MTVPAEKTTDNPASGGEMAALLQKYNVQGPRYTSYPTVPYWETAPREEEWVRHLAAELKATEKAGGGAALYLHLPFCESLCTFCACNRIVTRRHERSRHYIDLLHREWKLYRERLGFSVLPLAELHLGGGTPTFFTPEELSALLEPLLGEIALLPHGEMSFEADPRVTTLEHLETLARLGFRRISLGIQDYDPKVQKAIHREQSPGLVNRLVAAARGLGYNGVNFDLVYGLPHQTLESIEETARTVIAQKPDRIACYAYAHVPWVGKTGQRGFDEADLPSGDAKLKLYIRVRDLLLEAGYLDIGMDHFALPHDPLFRAAEAGTLHRNFMGYVPHKVSPLIGLGVSSISDAWTCFAQNEKELDAYEARLLDGKLPIHRGHVLTDEDLLLRRAILDLMTSFHTGRRALAALEGGGFGQRLDEAVADGLAVLDGDAIRVTARGRPFVRNICMAFDARMQRARPESQIFSRTI